MQKKCNARFCDTCLRDERSARLQLERLTNAIGGGIVGAFVVGVIWLMVAVV